MNAQNLDQLTHDERCVLAFAMDMPHMWWPSSYMIEVRLDHPFINMIDGGDGYRRHAGGGSRHYAKHYDAADWAVIHQDDEDWQAQDLPAMRERGEKLIQCALRVLKGPEVEDDGGD